MNPSLPVVRVTRDPQALYELAAEVVTDRLRSAIARAGRGTIALSGGRTPEGLYRALAGPLWHALSDWSRIDVFWGDERHVPPDDAASNYRMAKNALLDSVAVPGTRVLRVLSEAQDPARAAAAYEAELRAVVGAPPGTLPRLDVILLGIGDDGHCASLFPGTAALEERERLVVPNWVEKLSTWRFTFTFPLINAARAVVFMAEGATKAPAVAAALRGGRAHAARGADASSVPGTERVTDTRVPGTEGGTEGGSLVQDEVPAGRVRPVDGELIWFLDEGAAQALAPRP